MHPKSWTKPAQEVAVVVEEVEAHPFHALVRGIAAEHFHPS